MHVIVLNEGKCYKINTKMSVEIQQGCRLADREF